MINKGVIVPISLAGIVLILVLATAITKNDFKRSPAETLQIAKERSHFIGVIDISAIPPGQAVILKIGIGKVPAFAPEIETKDLEISGLLPPETKALLSENKKKKILFSTSIADAVKAWTFLTRMGYNNLFIFDPDMKIAGGKNDSSPQGNESFQYTFKPEME
jgi:hypothetical protein